MWKISLIVISFGLFGIISAQYDYIDEQENEILEQYVDGFSGSYPGVDVEELPFESPDGFEELRKNPKFPPSELEDDKSKRVKRSRLGNKINKSPLSNRSGGDHHKIDDKIRDSPDVADNSKFHGNEFLMNDE